MCTPSKPGASIRQQLHVAQADAIALETTYKKTKQQVVELEAELDGLEGADHRAGRHRPGRRAAGRGGAAQVRGRGPRRPSSAAGPRT